MWVFSFQNPQKLIVLSFFLHAALSTFFLLGTLRHLPCLNKKRKQKNIAETAIEREAYMMSSVGCLLSVGLSTCCCC